MLERDEVEPPPAAHDSSGWQRLRHWGARLREHAPRLTMSVRTRLVMLVLAVVLPGTLAALWAAWRAGEERLVRHLRDDARALSMVVDRELAQRAAIARVLALARTLDTLPDIEPAQLQLLETQARRAVQGLDGWVVLSTPDEVLFSTRLAPSTGEEPLSSRRPREPGAPPLANRPMVGSLEPGRHGIPSHASLVQPVERRGHVLANLEVTIVPLELQRLINHQDLPPDWTAAVLDGRGHIVASSSGGPALTEPAAWPALSALMQAHDEALLQGRNPNGQAVLTYFSTSSQGWSFIITAPRERLAGGQLQSLLPVLLGAMVLLAMGLAGALWLSRRIARPLDDLTSMAQTLQTGGPLRQQPTGIEEWDYVSRALVNASEAMRRSRSELEQRVNEAVERTRETEQLSSRSQRIAALGRLTGGVAHDFNNLLGVISNSAHLIQRHVHNEALQVPLSAIRRSVEVGSRLTQHLLRFAGQQAVHPQSLDLASTLKDLEALLSTVLGKRVSLSMDLQPGVRLVTADPAELELALINIALNARDALNGAGKVHFSLRNAREDELAGLAPGAYVLIKVADDGPGIPPDILPRVFEPFFTSKPVGRATGLGLSQVLGFCVQAGGTARIHCPPEGGTVVSLLLPASQTRAPAEAGAEAGATSSLAGARVMLVEDNEELSRVTATLLRSFSCQVLCVYDADEALRRFGTGAGIDVVLSDVMMPGRMDGLTLVKALRAMRPELPAVLISGYSATPVTDDPTLIVLRKPCSPAQLLDALRRAISGPQATRD
ncbi:hybrid sensor histidine kinase/response regulator [Pelomonas sp. BJYL3]|uniref:hybrid sensor histidine kinase/response regulator n=1 Tax=Pelomonas sp. BJYL3 TaxID=2976697 RepID=UPI0022B2B35D|nr:ATP-binding protein [Pelomonas sp. BJYL3]